MDNDGYNNEKTFPERKHIRIIRMEADESLEVSVLRNDERMHYHGKINCPKGTKLYNYLLEISGPLKPGLSWDSICYNPDGSKIVPEGDPVVDVFDFFKPGSLKKGKKPHISQD